MRVLGRGSPLQGQVVVELDRRRLVYRVRMTHMRHSANVGVLCIRDLCYKNKRAFITSPTYGTGSACSVPRSAGRRLARIALCVHGLEERKQSWSEKSPQASNTQHLKSPETIIFIDGPSVHIIKGISLSVDM